MNKISKRQAIGFISTFRAVIILVIMCIIAALLSPAFLSVNNLFNVVRQIAVVAIVGCGMTFVILTGGIDLSVGAIIGLSGAISAGVLASTGNVALAMGAGLLIGVLCGAANGFFVAKCGIPSFIATLGMMTLLRGCVLVYTKGAPIPIREEAYKWVGKEDLLGIPIPILLLIVIFALAYFVLGHTKYGRSVYALGGNREATRLSGIPVVKTEWITYIISGLMCGIAAIVLTARLGSAQSTGGTGYELDAIAAVILGGTSLSGGVGFVLPTVVGALIMGIIDNILTLLNVNPHATNIVKGAVILIAVLADKKVKDLSTKVNE